MTRTLLRASNNKRTLLGAKTRAIFITTWLTVGMGVISVASAQQSIVAGLAYDAQTQGAVPIPPAERALQTAVAEPWFKVSKEGLILEGAIFDRSGNLLFCEVSGRRVLRLTPDKQLSTVVRLDALAGGGWLSTRTSGFSSRRWTSRTTAARSSR